MPMTAEQVRAVLHAYREVVETCWPDLHPAIGNAAAGWSTADCDDLAAELERYLRATEAPGSAVRVFWKWAPRFTFGGCNARFGRDAGLPPEALVGADDFDHRLPWRLQAAKYRQDDEAVLASGRPQLDIVERQRSSAGEITWVRAAKTVLRRTDGTPMGILGAYEVLDNDTGRKLFAERLRDTTRPPPGR